VQEEKTKEGEKEGDCGIAEEVINLPLKNRSNFVYGF
jgi:hypothetical protein